MLGYDCGTMGTKVADAYRPHVIEYPRPGWAEMDPEQFYRVTSAGIAECMRKSRVNPKEIRGISCSGVLCGIVPVDERWKATGPYIPPMMLRRLLKNEKELLFRTKKVVTAAHYVMGKLGGFGAREAFTCAEAKKLGLAEGTPLVAGGGDMQQSCLGSGVVETGVCSDVAGTASNFNYSVGGFTRGITKKKVLMLAMHTLEDQYLYWAIVPGGGLSLRWFRDDIMSELQSLRGRHYSEGGKDE